MSDGFKIEKGVPIPAKGRGSGLRYPFEDMEPGDSFPVAIPEGVKPKTIYGRLNAAIASRQKRWPHKRFTVRLVDERDEAGNPIKRVRVWRDADAPEGR